jgi:type I restriction enzyme S subunit
MNGLKTKWEKVELNELCSLSIEKEQVKEFNNYRLVGIRLWGQGLYERDSIVGHSTQYKFFTKSRTGDLLFNKIWARNGAISVVQEQHNGLYVSPEFPVYSLNKDNIIQDWMYYYTKYFKFWEFCNEKSRGTSGKNRIKPENFLNISIPLPPPPEQKRIVKIIKSIEEKQQQINKLNKEQEKDIKNTLYSTYIDLIKDAEYKSMKEIAPIIRRPVKINAEEKYPELGIRCFGNGTFHKPALSGIEVGTKKLFQIKTGDLVFSNVFAWEGGIAVAKEEDNDRYGSHRFISCNCDLEQVKPSFLNFHFLAPKGLEEINNCSPGGAGRNKTLGLKKLEAIKVPVPKIDKQRKFENLLNQFNQLKEQREEREKELAQLIPSLLDKAFKGEL